MKKIAAVLLCGALMSSMALLDTNLADIGINWK